MKKNKKTDFLLSIPELLALANRANLLYTSEKMETIKPFLGIAEPYNVTAAEVNGIMSRSTFYRTLKALTDESEIIRERLTKIVML